MERTYGNVFASAELIGYYDKGALYHNGTEKGYSYIIDESITIGVDTYQHLRTTMDENAEFLTKRPIKVKMVSELDI